MKRKLRVVLGVLAATVILATTACSGAEAPNTTTAAAGAEEAAPAEEKVERQPQNVHVACGTSTGVNYLTVTTVGTLLSKQYPEYVFTPEITTGGVENIGLILSGDAVFGSAMTDDVLACNNSERKWEGSTDTKDKLRYITSGNQTSITQFARKDTGVKSFADTKGLKMAVASGTMYNYYWPMLLETYGMTEDDFESVTVMGLKDILTAVQDGIVDYGCHVSSTPNASIQDTALAVGLNILTMTDEEVAKMTELNPVFMPFQISSDVYSSDFDAQTVCLYNAYVTTEDADQQLIYDFVKCLTENNETLKAAHPQAGIIGSLDNVLPNQRIPFAEGAERYYREIGLIKD